MNNNYFENKVAIVTGGSSGIGFSLCKELLNRGAIVYLLGHNKDHVESAIYKLSEYKNKVYPLVADVSVKDEIQSAIKDVKNIQGRLDFLFNNAGIGDPNLAIDVTLDDWQRMLNTNLWSIIYATDVALPIMVEQDFGHIINTASLGGLIPKPHGVMYATTKFAVVGLTESLKYEYNDSNINFSTICPGVIITDIFLKNKGEDNSKDSTLTEIDKLEKIKEAYKGLNPITPDEAAVEMLDKVSQNEGIIIVPEKPWTQVRLDYVTGSEEANKYLLHNDPKKDLQKDNN